MKSSHWDPRRGGEQEGEAPEAAHQDVEVAMSSLHGAERDQTFP